MAVLLKVLPRLSLPVPVSRPAVFMHCMSMSQAVLVKCFNDSNENQKARTSPPRALRKNLMVDRRWLVLADSAGYGSSPKASFAVQLQMTRDLSLSNHLGAGLDNQLDGLQVHAKHQAD